MKIVINPQYSALQSFVHNIHFSFESEGEIIYNERNKLKKYTIEGYDIIVKRFRKPHIINKIAYSFFRASKAERSYKNALILLGKGISTPTPIGYIEEKKCLLNLSYYICIYESGYTHIRNEMLGGDCNPLFYKELAHYIADSHNKCVYHLDLSPGNILVKKSNHNYHFTMVDINRMKFPHKMSDELRYQSFKRLSENATVLNSIATEYAIDTNLDIKVTIEKITKYSSAFFNSKKRKIRNIRKNSYENRI